MEQKSTPTILKISLWVLTVVLLGLSALLVTGLMSDSSDRNEVELSFTTSEIVPPPLITPQPSEVGTNNIDNIAENLAKTNQVASQVTVIENSEEKNEEDEGADKENEVQISSSNAKITELEAKQIAEQETGGKVTDVDTDRIKGRDAWEIEIKKNGKEADVLIDMETGAVLAVEWETDEDDD